MLSLQDTAGHDKSQTVNCCCVLLIIYWHKFQIRVWCRPCVSLLLFRRHFPLCFFIRHLYLSIVARIMSVMCTDERSLLCIMSRHAPYCWLATSLFWYSAPTRFLKRFWKNAYPTFNSSNVTIWKIKYAKWSCILACHKLPLSMFIYGWEENYHVSSTVFFPIGCRSRKSLFICIKLKDSELCRITGHAPSGRYCSVAHVTGNRQLSIEMNEIVVWMGL